jgi:recombination protein RecA
MATEDNRSKSLELAVTSIERQYGKGAIMRLGKQEPVPVEVIPSGALSLDLSLGIGGYPKGRIIEVYGPESSGKTTLTLHAIAECQKMGGVAAFIDAEHALDVSYARKLGVNTEELLVSQPDYGEQALEIADTLVRSGAVDIIVVDSVAALVPKAEIEGEMGDSHVGLQARLMSQALRKLTGSVHRSNTMLFFINQIRMKIGVMFGSPETTTGGNALKFYSSVRLDVRRVGAIKVGELAIGNRTRVKVVKNKLAPPFASCEFDILFGEGISKSGDALDLGVEANVVEKSGAWYTYAGERIGQGRETARAYLKEHPEALAEIERKVLLSKGVERGKPAAVSPAEESDAQRAASKAAKAEARDASRAESAKADAVSKGEGASRPRPRA